MKWVVFSECLCMSLDEKKNFHAKLCLAYINVEFIILVCGYHSSLPPDLTQKILISELSFPSFFSPNLVIIIPNLLTISLMIVWIVITIIISHYANIIIWSIFFQEYKKFNLPLLMIFMTLQAKFGCKKWRLTYLDWGKNWLRHKYWW